MEMGNIAADIKYYLFLRVFFFVLFPYIYAQQLND